MKSVLIAAAMALSAGAASAVPMPTYATNIVDANLGGGARGPDGDIDLNRTLGMEDGLFASPGISGFFIFSFGTPFAGTAHIYETTVGACTPSSLGCVEFPETAAIWVGNSWTVGGSAADLTSTFTKAGEVTNDGVASSIPNTRKTSVALPSGNWTLLAIRDKSFTGTTSGVNAGFDVDAVSVTPVPVPAALPLLMAALGGMVFLKRRGNAQTA